MHEHTFQIWSNREMQWMVNPHIFSRYWAEVVPYSCVLYSPLFPFCRANHYMIWASLQQSQLPKVVLAFHSFIPACTCTCAQTSGALPPYHWIAYQTQSRRMLRERCMLYCKCCRTYIYNLTSSFFNRLMKQTLMPVWRHYLMKKIGYLVWQRLHGYSRSRRYLPHQF